MKIGNTSFNPEAFENISKEEFKATYRGKIDVDLDHAWERIQGERIRLGLADKKEAISNVIDQEPYQERLPLNKKDVAIPAGKKSGKKRKGN